MKTFDDELLVHDRSPPQKKQTPKNQIPKSKPQNNCESRQGLVKFVRTETCLELSSPSINITSLQQGFNLNIFKLVPPAELVPSSNNCQPAIARFRCFTAIDAQARAKRCLGSLDAEGLNAGTFFHRSIHNKIFNTGVRKLRTTTTSGRMDNTSLAVHLSMACSNNDIFPLMRFLST